MTKSGKDQKRERSGASNSGAGRGRLENQGSRSGPGQGRSKTRDQGNHPGQSRSQSTSGAIKATWLYFLLPEKTRRRIDSFLPPSDQNKLLVKRKALSKSELALDKEPFFKQITDELTKARSSSGKETGDLKNIFLGFHVLIHVIILALALAEGMNFIAGVIFFYAIGGVIFILQKSSTYLRYRYSPLPVYPRYAFVSALGYAIMVLTVGWLSVEADFPRPDAIMLVVGALLAPFFEELLFRDVIYKIVEDVAESSFLAIAVGALFFALVHFQGDFHVIDLLIYTLAGAILGVIRWSTGKLFYPIIVHAGVNLTILLL